LKTPLFSGSVHQADCTRRAIAGNCPLRMGVRRSAVVYRVVSSGKGDLMLLDIAVAVPPFKVEQKKATEELKARMVDRPAVSRMIDSASLHSGIRSRYVVVPDAEEAPTERFFGSGEAPVKPGTAVRMEEYERWSKILGLSAAREVLARNPEGGERLERLITISCTGFYAPGLDCYLIKELGLSPAVRRMHIGFMGCAASLVGFANVLESQSRATEPNSTLLVSVELCSLHLQTHATRDNILANILFADGAGAVLFSRAKGEGPGPRLDLVDSSSLLLEDSSKFMGWKIGDQGFEMSLSPELPSIIRCSAVPALLRILGQFGLSPREIAHWALHPGGRAILDALQDGLELSDGHLEPSRAILRDFGNMSSVSILFVLQRLLRSNSLSEGEFCCALAFGPGLSMEVVLMRVVA
jgi:predicted naringenin-chalcone synthase